MIVIVAPYTPSESSLPAHLGAARKLESIISILARLDSQLVLINSAHHGIGPSPLTSRQVTIGRNSLLEITPPLSTNATLGKLWNIFSVKQVIAELQKIENPKCIWFYNGYAFEMCFAIMARKIFNAPMILEFEDWHFSRGRGFNPKPYLDFFLWRIAARFIKGAFVVNAFLARKMLNYSQQVELLPGIVPTVLANINTKFPPFSSNSRTINVGFFGGLSVEKGADIVLKLAELLPNQFKFHVTGTGPLADNFRSFTVDYPERLIYHGRVDDIRLYQLIADCDVLLNPHSSIENMNNGVFPFKVIEAVASGRLLISTPVPMDGLEDVLLGVCFVEHSLAAFQMAILESRQYYFNHQLSVKNGAINANAKFGDAAVLEKIQAMLNTIEI